MKYVSIFIVLAIAYAGMAAASDKEGGRPEQTCVVSGCSGQVCADAGVITTCEWRQEYACYRDAICERTSDGCAWRMTPELRACLTGSQTFDRYEMKKP